MLDQLSTKIRPNRKYKTDRKDLDGGSLDIHKAIGKLPKPKGGWTLPGHRYTGALKKMRGERDHQSHGKAQDRKSVV